MPRIDRTKYYSVANNASGAVTFDCASDVNLYYIKAATASPALSGNLSFGHTGTPKEGMLFRITYNAGIVTGANTLTIFGANITTRQALIKLVVLAYYDGSGWVTTVHPDHSGAEFVSLTNLDPNIIDNVTLEKTIHIHVKDAGVTLAKLENVTSAYIILGNGSNRPVAVAVSGDIAIDNAGVVTIGNLKIGTAKIVDKAVTLAKIQDITRGYILAGGATDLPVLVNAKTSAYILIGDGTDVISVALSGDVSITAAGVVSIGNQKIVTAMIADANVTLDKLVNLASGQILVGNGSNRPVAVTPSGDFTLATTGVATIANNAITSAKILNGAVTKAKVALENITGGYDGIIGTKVIMGAALKALLDGSVNNLFAINANEVVLSIMLAVQTISGSVATIEMGPDANARTAGADSDGILKAGDTNVAAMNFSYVETYKGALQAFGAFKADANGFITIKSSSDISGSGFVGGVIMYYMIKN